MARIVSFFLVIMLAVSFSTTTFAQQAGGGTGDAPKSSLMGPRKQIATIVFAGLAGAVLGLSTLSFYGRPQDYLSNIAIGFAIGIIGGTVYVTYKAASQPQEFYGSNMLMPDTGTQRSQFLLSQATPPAHTLNLGWSF